MDQKRQTRLDLTLGQLPAEVRSKPGNSSEDLSIPFAWDFSMHHEALFYLSRVNAKEKFIVLNEAISLNGKSLPDVYVSRSSGLMDDVEVYKYVCGFDIEKDSLIKVRGKGKVWYHKLVVDDLLDFSKKERYKTRYSEIDDEIQLRLQRLVEAFKNSA